MSKYSNEIRILLDKFNYEKRERWGMNMYQLIMNDKELKKAVLVEFGFGEVSPIKVEKWVKKHYPLQYKKLNKQMVNNSNVVPMTVEAMSKENRNAIIDEVYGTDKTFTAREVMVMTDELVTVANEHTKTVEEAIRLNNQMSESYEEMSESYKEMLASSLESNKQAIEAANRTYDEYQKIMNREQLLIHFLATKELEDEFMEFMENLKMEETRPEYTEAIESLVDTHDPCFLDEYGWYKEYSEEKESDEAGGNE